MNTPQEENSKTVSLESLCVFMNQMKVLDEKYKIKEFSDELTKVYKVYNSYDDVKNISMISDNFEDALNIDPKDIKTYIKQYKHLKKKYKYNDYVKEASCLRNDFLNKRKGYFFNTIKPVISEVSKSSAKPRKFSEMEKLSIDFSEQHFISKWVDKVVKNNKDVNLHLSYEDVDGAIKHAIIGFKNSEFYPDGSIETPLIDRTTGVGLFDSFLLHSFYEVKIKKWIYIPVKFIIKIQSGAEVDEQKNKSV